MIGRCDTCSKANEFTNKLAFTKNPRPRGCRTSAATPEITIANNMRKGSHKLKTPARANRLQHVVIIGAGRMGADIALAFALGGWQCNVLENDPDVRDRANAHWRQELKRLRVSRTIDLLRMHADAETVDWKQADLAVECVFEDLALKRKLLKSIEALMRRDAI